jgi:hypothetical protein
MKLPSFVCNEVRISAIVKQVRATKLFEIIIVMTGDGTAILQKLMEKGADQEENQAETAVATDMKAAAGSSGPDADPNMTRAIIRPC